MKARIKQMKKCLVIFFVVLLVFAFFPCAVLGAADNMDEYLEKFYELGELEDFNESNAVRSFYELFGYGDFKAFLKDLINGEVKIDLTEVIALIKGYIEAKLLPFAATIISLCALSVISSVSGALSASLSSNAQKAVSYSLYLASCSIIISVFANVKDGSLALCAQISEFCFIAFPVMLSLLFSSGGLITAAAISPVVFLAMDILAAIITSLLIPASVLCFFLSVLQYGFDSVDVSNLIDLLKKFSAFVLGLCSFVFTAVIAFEGITFASSDAIKSVGVKTAAKFIPVAGDFMAASIDTVRGFALLIGNTLGTVAAGAIVVIVLIPSVELIACWLCMTFSAVITQMIGDKKISSVISAAAGCLYRILTYCLILSGLCVVVIGVIVALSNYMFAVGT